MIKRILNVSLFIKLMCLVFTVICILTTSIMLTVNHQAREAFTTQALRKLDSDNKALDEILRQKGEEMRKVAVAVNDINMQIHQLTDVINSLKS